jgi:tetratricopeptide (TPR) repeat protein
MYHRHRTRQKLRPHSWSSVTLRGPSSAVNIALATEPGMMTALVTKVGALRNLGQPHDALNTLEELSQITTAPEELLRLKAELLKEVGEITEAERTMEESIRFRANADSWRNLAGLRIKLNRFHDALEASKRALELDPSNLESLTVKAQALGGLNWRKKSSSSRHSPN